jgi:hypothetical protein
MAKPRKNLDNQAFNFGLSMSNSSTATFREEFIMDRTSIFTLAGQTVYGLVVRHTAETRFRMWSDEWSTLNIGQGQTIEVDFAGAWEEEMLVASITTLGTGYTWVSLVKPIIERSRKAAGRLLQTVG